MMRISEHGYYRKMSMIFEWTVWPRHAGFSPVFRAKARMEIQSVVRFYLNSVSARADKKYPRAHIFFSRYILIHGAAHANSFTSFGAIYLTPRFLRRTGRT